MRGKIIILGARSSNSCLLNVKSDSQVDDIIFLPVSLLGSETFFLSLCFFLFMNCISL